MTELSDLERQRHLKLQRIRERGIDPYPHRVERTHTTAQARAAFEKAQEEEVPTVKVSRDMFSYQAVCENVMRLPSI